MDMGSLRAELQLPHHFITGEDENDLDEDIMMLGSTPQVNLVALDVPQATSRFFQVMQPCFDDCVNCCVIQLFQHSQLIF